MPEVGAHVIRIRLARTADAHQAAHQEGRQRPEDAPGRPPAMPVAPEASQEPKGAQRGR